MHARLQSMCSCLMLGLLFFALTGCAASRGDRDAKVEADKPSSQVATTETKPAAEQTQTQAAPESPQPALSAEDLTKKKDELKKKQKDLRKKERDIVRLERNLEVAQIKLDKTKITQEQAQRRNQESLARAEMDLDLAQQRYKTYMEKSLPSRIGWSQLNLQRVADNIQEAREELDQLETMYREDEVDAKTKEIVVGRSRLRLERSLRDQELRQADFDTMMNESMPVEKREQENQLQDRQRAVVNAKEAVQISELDARVNFMAAEDEVTRVGYELEDARESLADLNEEIAKLEKEIADAESAQPESTPADQEPKG